MWPGGTLRAIRFLLALGIAALAAAPALAEKRVALAVGIDVYDNLPALQQLKTAVNDARGIGAALRALGFAAEVEENVDRLAFARAWQRFLNGLEPGDTAALFFAGHGVEVAGVNYLLPRDVPRVESGEDRVLAAASIRFNDLMNDLSDRRVRVALFILDACRDNPFRDGIGRSVGGARGLARVEPAEGSFVMYSAGAGEQALDRLPGADSNPNSVYTRTLLPLLATPGLSLQDVAMRVRAKVVTVARGVGRKQTPAYYDQLVGRLVLKGGAAPAPESASAATPPAAAAAGEWARVDKSSMAELETFRRRHPASPEAEYALARLDALRKAEQRRRKHAALEPPSSRPVQPAAAGDPSVQANADPAALAGSWKGTYVYAGQGRRPVEFTLAVQVRGSACRGRTEELNTFGTPSVPKLYANVECRLLAGTVPRRVVLRKVYDGTGGQSHSIDYAGDLSLDGRNITGTWTVGAQSGRFWLSRQ